MYTYIVGSLKTYTMQVYKKKFIEDLENKKLIIGEVYVIKSKDENYSFEVTNYEGEYLSPERNPNERVPIALKRWRTLGVFLTLDVAISFAMFYGDSVHNYEYFFQRQKEGEAMNEGGRDSNPNIDAMGDLGWELCVVSQGMFIYKRVKIN